MGGRQSRSPVCRGLAEERIRYVSVLTTIRAHAKSRASLLDEGRLLEAILKMERGVASRDAARNRSPERPGAPPARHLRPGCEELAARVAEDNSADGSAAPGQKSPRWSAERRASRGVSAFTRVLRRTMGRRALRKRPVCRDMAGPPDAGASGRLSALRPPLGVGQQVHDPGANAPRERKMLGCLISLDGTTGAILGMVRAEIVGRLRFRRAAPYVEAK